MTSFQDLLTRYVINPGLQIAGGGVRYGSVIYIGFGDTWTENLRGRWDVRRFAVEVEFGADEWSCLVDGKAYLGSNRPDLSLERDELDDIFIGGRLLNTSLTKVHFDLVLSGDVLIRSVVKPNQASGFLLTLSLADAIYETLDGCSLVD